MNDDTGLSSSAIHRATSSGSPMRPSGTWLAPPDEHHRGARGAEQPRGRGIDPAARAGDDDRRATQTRPTEPPEPADPVAAMKASCRGRVQMRAQPGLRFQRAWVLADKDFPICF
jgi:hypothetical protein